MLRTMLKSKIHRARVTGADLNYVGSITIDARLMQEADILPGEKVQVVNNNNGARFETYAIPGEWGSGIICLNGAAARLVQTGDVIILITYCQVDETEAVSLVPKIVLLDEANRVQESIPEVKNTDK